MIKGQRFQCEFGCGVCFGVVGVRHGCARVLLSEPAEVARVSRTIHRGRVLAPLAMVDQLGGNPMISSLTSGLGLNASQAVGGAGALLGLAQNKLPKADWSKITKSIPGTGDMIKTANSLGGITGKTGSLADLTGAFSKMGISADQASKRVPAVSDYVGKAAGPDVGAALAGVLK